LTTTLGSVLSVAASTPLLGGIDDQHLANLCAGDAQLSEIELHRTAADDPHQVLGAEGVLVAVDFGIGRGPFDGDLRPVGVHLLGDDERERRHRALTHLGAGAQDRDRAVWRDADPWIDCGVGQGIRLCLRHQAHAVVSDRDAERHSAQAGDHAAT